MKQGVSNHFFPELKLHSELDTVTWIQIIKTAIHSNAIPLVLELLRGSYLPEWPDEKWKIQYSFLPINPGIQKQDPASTRRPLTTGVLKRFDPPKTFFQHGQITQSAPSELSTGSLVVIVWQRMWVTDCRCLSFERAAFSVLCYKINMPE